MTINAMFLIYCCKYVGLSESIATTYFGFYMLALLLGRFILYVHYLSDPISPALEELGEKMKSGSAF